MQRRRDPDRRVAAQQLAGLIDVNAEDDGEIEIVPLKGRQLLRAVPAEDRDIDMRVLPRKRRQGDRKQGAGIFVGYADPQGPESGAMRMVAAVSSKRAMTARACGRSLRPGAVSAMPRGPRTSSGWPTISSSRFICMLTADCVRPIASAAWVTLPRSATAMKVRRRSLSRGVFIEAIDFPYSRYHDYSFL